MEASRQKLTAAIKAVYGLDFAVEVSAAPAETGADYASNVALKLAKLVHRAPMEIAEALAAKIDGCRVEVAAPGFLNFYLPEQNFIKIVNEWNRPAARESLQRQDEPMARESLQGQGEPAARESLQEQGGVEMRKDLQGRGEPVARRELKNLQKQYKGKTVICEFSDPNPFKVLHVGHLYTSVVGDALSRLMELAGAQVVRANFGGDVGLHVAKTLYALKSGLDDLTIEKIAAAYVEGTRLYDEDEAARQRITELNKEIYQINAQDKHDTELAQLYWRGRELSYQYFEDFYASIGVKFDRYYPESTVAGRGLQEVRAHTGSVYEESAGAVVYRGEKVGLHTRVFINREGVPTYEAKDVGLIFTKWDDYHFDESVVVTGNEQTEYMKVVLASVSEYAPELTERTVHLTHGLVKLAGNVKMSSRKGNFLKAVDVLQMVREMLGGAAAGEGTADVRAAAGEGTADVRAAAGEGTAADESAGGACAPDERVVLAAIKYAFLKYKMGGDIVFDPQESVAINGNSGVYLLYSAVRAKKILQSVTGVELYKKINNPYERKLSKKIVQYEETLMDALADKAPNKICTYLYELAQEFSRFYEQVKVVGNEREAELAGLVRAYLAVMTHGLGLLGIEIPEEM